MGRKKKIDKTVYLQFLHDVYDRTVNGWAMFSMASVLKKYGINPVASVILTDEKIILSELSGIRNSKNYKWNFSHVPNMAMAERLEEEVSKRLLKYKEKDKPYSNGDNGIFNLLDESASIEESDFDRVLMRHSEARPVDAKQFVRTGNESVEVSIGKVHISIKVSASGEVEIDVKKE